MARRSTPATAIHACSVPDVKTNGRPEENPKNNNTEMLRLVNTFMMSLRTELCNISPLWIHDMELVFLKENSINYTVLATFYFSPMNWMVGNAHPTV